MQYEAEGAVAFLPGRRNHTYSPEVKLQAVQELYHVVRRTASTSG